MVCLALVGACGTGGSPINITVDAGLPTTLATGAARGPYDIAVDATHVYWTDIKANAVMKVPKEGGATVTLASDPTHVSRIAVDSTYVYWISGLRVMKVALAGGTPLQVAELQNGLADVAADGTSVYWTTRGTVMKASRETGAVTMLTTGLSGGPMAVDATAVYWITIGEPLATIYKVPLAGGDAAWLAGGVDPSSLASDGSNLYFTNYDMPKMRNSVMKIPPGGGDPIELVAVGGQSIVVDGSTLYWSCGSICRMSAEGGPVTKIATGDQVLDLVVDRTHFYWISAEGDVMAMAKP